MAAGATYEPIATTTLSGTSTTITFSSISSAYTDLRIVFVGTANSSDDLRLKFNGDTGANYSRQDFFGDGTSAISAGASNSTSFGIAVSAGLKAEIAFLTIDIFSYSGSLNKTSLVTYSYNRAAVGTGYVYRQVGLWRDTTAINAFTLTQNTSFQTGTTVSLYGILKA